MIQYGTDYQILRRRGTANFPSTTIPLRPGHTLVQDLSNTGATVTSETLEVSPTEAKARLARGQAILVDVREPEEFALSRIEGTELIPMQTVPAQLQHLEALADERELLVLCHHGVRSLQVAAWLRERGIENCFSVAGGIDQWSREVDAEVSRY